MTALHTETASYPNHTETDVKNETGSALKLEEFAAKVENECVTGTAIDFDSFESAIETVEGIEVTALNDATAPVHDATKTATCPSYLCPRHYEELLSSGISQTIIEKNFRTINDSREVDRVLNRNTKRRTKHSDHLVPCWEVTGLDPLGWERTEDGVQIKPDNPEHDENGKPKKYIGATGYDTAPLFLETDDIDHWEKVLKNVSIPLFITEGAKKAGSGLSISLATISLPGVSTCRKMGRLHRNLEVFCKFGRTVYLCFDNDAMTKKPVIQALLAMGREISAKGAKVMVVVLPPGEAKGMDDFIYEHGEEEFKKLVDDALTIEEWRKRLEDQWAREASGANDSSRKVVIEKADIMGEKLTEEYRDKLIWNNEHKTWFLLGSSKPGIWGMVDDHVVETLIQANLQAKGIRGYGTDSYIVNIRKFISRNLCILKWQERQNCLPFEDGVVDIGTGKFEEHSPGNYLTWCLPRKYNNNVVSDWGSIRNWLSEAWTNPVDRETILCFFAASIQGRYDLQKFLYLVGTGGSGKGTLTRLLQVILGSRNTWAGKIENLADKNDCARLVGKRLAVFADQDKVTSGMQFFKNLTGGDYLPAKRLYKDGFDFLYEGLAIITANAPALLGAGSWIKRRAIVVNCNYQPEVERNLDAEFEPELAAFTRYLLSISNEQIDKVLKYDRPTSGAVTPAFWDMAQRQDSIAAWVEECIFFDERAFTQVGKNKDEWRDNAYNPEISTLFGSYHHYCRSTGLQGKSLNNFAPELEELCQKVLGYKFVVRDRNMSVRGFKGLRLRREVDSRVSDNLSHSILYDNPNVNHHDDHHDDLEVLLNKDYDNHDNQLEKKDFDKFEDSGVSEIITKVEITQTIEIGCHGCHPIDQEDHSASVFRHDDLGALRSSHFEHDNRGETLPTDTAATTTDTDAANASVAIVAQGILMSLWQQITANWDNEEQGSNAIL